ncbi:unnamed protein product [Cuscuta epithymum]|uniref:Uncharacterized protein n=1 Tax=Cuscuta epithymum TaxID=186058 RepID=A0AAV0DSK9_9ASTE|nr:unnamed protein product [Cuscuta epithymum]
MDAKSSSRTFVQDPVKYNECMEDLVVPDSEEESDEVNGEGLLELVVPDSEEELDDEHGQLPTEAVIPDSEEHKEMDEVPESEASRRRREVQNHPIRKPRLEAFLKIIINGWESRMWDIDT